MPGFLNRLIGALRGGEVAPPVSSATAYGVHGYFDAAKYSVNRQQMYLPDLSSADVSDFELNELWKKSEYLYKNNGVMRRLVKGSARYSVGRGIVPAAATDDREWNKEQEKRFDDWAGNAGTFDVAARFDFYQSQRALACGMMRIGDAFANFSKSQSGEAPMLQFFEGSRIHGQAGEARGKTEWKNGVKVNRLTRPLAYSLYRGRGEPNAKLDVNKTAHIWDPERMSGERGLPWAYHCLTKLIDWKEIAAAVSAGVKQDQMQGLVIKQTGKTGGPAGLEGTVGSTGVVTPDERNRRYEEILGLMARWYLEPGEDVESFQSDKPHERVEKWMNYLVRDAAHGFGISPELAWNLGGVGGAPMRWILADGQRFFEEIQEIMIRRYCRRVWIYKTAWDIRAGVIDLPKGKKPWWAHSWITPQQVTVDRTKDGKLEIELIKNALNSVPRYYRALGLEWEDVVKEQLDFLEWLKAECAKRDLCMADVIAPAPNASVAFDVPAAESE